MGTSGQEPILDEAKKGEILAILSVGCSRETAARYVGCSTYVIDRAAQRDSQFADQLRRADIRAEVGCLKSIQKAARQERYWRAAAWAMERRNPAEYALRPAATMTYAEVEQLLEQIARLIVESLPASRQRQALLRRLQSRVRELLGPQAPRTPTYALEIPAEH